MLAFATAENSGINQGPFFMITVLCLGAKRIDKMYVTMYMAYILEFFETTDIH